MPTNQSDKSFIQMAGEFGVASELSRRRIHAYVTYGTNKSADIFALNESGEHVIKIEVKSTVGDKWPLSGRVGRGEPSPRIIWVFVSIPKLGSTGGAEYFIVSDEEVHEIYAKGRRAYVERHSKKHGRDPEGPGVPQLSKQDVSAHKDKWEKISAKLK